MHANRSGCLTTRTFTLCAQADLPVRHRDIPVYHLRIHLHEDVLPVSGRAVLAVMCLQLCLALGMGVWCAAMHRHKGDLSFCQILFWSWPCALNNLL